MENDEGNKGAAGSEGDESGKTDTTPTVPVIEGKTVPESDLLAVKSAHDATKAELKTANETVASERASKEAAEGKLGTVETLTRERDELKVKADAQDTQLSALAVGRVTTLRQELIARGVAEDKVNTLGETDLNLIKTTLPAAVKGPEAKGLDVEGRGNEDYSGLTAREKITAGIQEAKA